MKKISQTLSSSFGLVFRKFQAKMQLFPVTMKIGGVIMGLFLFVAVARAYLAPYSPNDVGLGLPFSPPSWEHLLGTDMAGRDVFSRVVYGTRDVIVLSLTSTTIAMLAGSLLGLASGLIGGWFDEILMRLLELLISFPVLIFALLVIAAAGRDFAGTQTLIIGVVAIVYAPRIARMARSVALDLVKRDFVTIAKTRGETVWEIVWHELLPNATGVLLVEFGVRAGQAPLLVGSLGFLGLGARPPTPEWGLMISENRVALVYSPIPALGPAFALALLVIGLNLFTDGLARFLGRSTKYGLR